MGMNVYEQAVKDALELRIEARAKVLATLYVGECLASVAGALRDLGNGNASTPMGAIEGLAVQLREGLDGIASAALHAAED